MATLHFVRPGTTRNGEHSTRSIDIEAKLAVAVFSNTRNHWSANEPTFDSEHVTTGYEALKYVVLELSALDVSESFPKPGFYTLEVTGAEAGKMLEVHAPPDASGGQERMETPPVR